MTKPTQAQIEAAVEAFCKSAGYPMEAKYAEGSNLKRDLIAALTAAAEVGEDYELKCTNGHDRCYMGTSDDCPYCERVFPAAAEVGEKEFDDAIARSKARFFKLGWKDKDIEEIKAATIERCAQVAETYKTNPPQYWSLEDVRNGIAAAIRARGT